MRIEKGVTLIELVITIVVVSIIAIPIGRVIGQQVIAIVDSRDYVIAQNLLRFEMEKARNLSYSNIITQNLTNYEGYPYDVNRTVSYELGSAGSAESVKRVEVKVYLAGADQSSTGPLASAVTYIAKNVSF